MKRRVFILLFAGFFIFVILICFRPAVLFLIRAQLNKIFTQAEFSLKNLSVEFSDAFTLEVKIDSLDRENLHIEGVDGKLNFFKKARALSIRRLGYDRVTIEDIRATTLLKNKALSLSSISAKVLGGEVSADINLCLDKENRYVCTFEFRDLNLEEAVNNLNLEERFLMSGKLSGSLEIEGRALDLARLAGDFSLPAPGGMLVIKDDRFLGAFVRNSAQPLDILVESLKNYHYNTGRIKLSLEKPDLLLNIALEGKAGKRSLDIVVHNFNKEKEGL
jgi:hypothetical protein